MAQFLILDNIVLPITKDASDIEWLDALDYFPSYRRHGGKYTWGAYVSWLLREAGEEGFKCLVELLGVETFLARFEHMPALA